MSVRTRFAPSPTGFLHIGNARTALFAWLFAKHHNGIFILRIEDTDLERSTEESVKVIVDSLQWLGLNWDEGYLKGGPHSPYRQIERLPIYKEYADKLIKEGKAFYCFCTKEELEEKRKSALNENRIPKYDGTCKNATASQIQKWESEGRKKAVRFSIPKGTTVVDDLIRGKVEFSNEMIGDFIIIKSDGVPSYNFAVVIDDHLMEITHVIRGEDHLSNTPKQILLYKAFDFNLPFFAHLSMILGPDKTRLSKRHGVTSVEQYKNEGYFPFVLLNYLSLLGWSHPQDKEIMPIDEIIKEFTLERVGKSPAVFNQEKLKWMNSQYIQKMPLGELAETAIEWFKKTYSSEQINSVNFPELVDFLRTQVSLVSEMPKFAKIYLDDNIQLSGESNQILFNAESKKVLESFRNLIVHQDKIIESDVKEIIKKVQLETSKKGKELFLPIRCALTGEMHGAELNKLIPILGKEKSLKRINSILRRNSE